jgi:hypothetical protein
MNEPQAIESRAVAKTRLTRAAAKADRVKRRQLEKSVSWTVPERLRLLWYMFCLAVTDVHCVPGLIADVCPPSYEGSYEGPYGSYEGPYGWYGGPFEFPWYAG